MTTGSSEGKVEGTDLNGKNGGRKERINFIIKESFRFHHLGTPFSFLICMAIIPGVRKYQNYTALWPLT